MPFALERITWIQQNGKIAFVMTKMEETSHITLYCVFPLT